MATSGGAKPSTNGSDGARAELARAPKTERRGGPAAGRTGMTLAERLRAERKAGPAKGKTAMTPAEKLAEKLKAEAERRAAAPSLATTSSMPLAAVEAPDAAEDPASDEPEPSEAIMTPRSLAEGTFDEPREKQPAWLVAAGLAVLVGVPGAWLATREDPPTTMAAIEGRPLPLEAEAVASPLPPQATPAVAAASPAPIGDDAAASGEPPVDPVAVSAAAQPAAETGAPQTAQIAQALEPPAVPEPAPVAAPTPSGGAAAPSPQAKARDLIRAGDRAYAAGQVAKAAGKYEAALAENPRAHAAVAGLGRIAFHESAYADAARHYGRAVKASASNGEYRILYGDSLFKLGKYADAKVQYTKAKSLGNAQADGRLKKVQTKLGK